MYLPSNRLFSLIVVFVSIVTVWTIYRAADSVYKLLRTYETLAYIDSWRVVGLLLYALTGISVLVCFGLYCRVIPIVRAIVQETQQRIPYGKRFNVNLVKGKKTYYFERYLADRPDVVYVTVKKEGKKKALLIVIEDHGFRAWKQSVSGVYAYPEDVPPPSYWHIWRYEKWHNSPYKMRQLLNVLQSMHEPHFK